MEWSNDADLHELFVTELTERSETLREGAAALREGTVTDDVAGAMVREGHTIKGTGKVMGFEAVAAAGLMCETVWRWIQHHELEGTPELAEALEHLAGVLVTAHDGAEDGVASAMGDVRSTLAGIDLPGELPDAPAPKTSTAGDKVSFDVVAEPVDATAVEPLVAPVANIAEVPNRGIDPDVASVPPAAAASAPASVRRSVDLAALLDHEAPSGPIVFDATADGKIATVAEPEPVPGPRELVAIEEAAFPVAVPRDDPTAQPVPHDPMTYDLGGLVGALQTWASAESVLVNAGGLYRLINDIAALRIDLVAAAEHTASLAATVVGAEPRLADDAEASAEATQAMLRATEELEGEALQLASTPLNGVTNTLPQLVRYLAKKTGTDVALELVGDDVLVDRQVLDHLGDAVRQLVVNGLVHGIEEPAVRTAEGKPPTGQLTVHAVAKGGQLEVTVSDDGAGVDWDRVRRVAFDRDLLVDPEHAAHETLVGFLYREGFTTVESADDLVGDGNGLARVKEIVESLYGTFTLQSAAGKGTTITMTVPRFRALQRALLVESNGQMWGIPDAAVTEVIPIGSANISVAEEGAKLDWRGEFLPFGSFSDVVGLEDDEPGQQVVVLSTPIGSAAVSVVGVSGSRDVAAKELGALLSGPQTVTGAALLGGDEVVLLVDAGRLAERLRDLAERPRGPVHRVLIVDDSKGVQQVVAGALASSGFATVVAGSVAEALGMLADYEVHALVVDFSMPRADGVALVHMVRQRYGEMPIVMLSGVANNEDIERAKKAGVDAFFDKGDFRKGALADTLRSLI